MKRSRQVPWVPVVVALSLLVLLVLVFVRSQPEPLTTEEILEKTEWTREELVTTLTRLQVQRRGRGVAREVYQHLRPHLERYDEAGQRAIMEESLTSAVGESLRQWRTLEKPMREKLVASLHEEAKKNRETVAALSQKDREKLEARLRDPKTQATMGEMRERLLNSLSPDDRVMLAPVVKEWIATLESL